MAVAKQRTAIRILKHIQITSISPEDVAASRAKPLHAATQDFAPSCFRSASEMFERKKPPVRAASKRL